jgi:glycerophosphoryl diester phosphodiesterase
MPSSPSRRAELERLGAVPFAHRGLHGGAVIENSRAAFDAALAAGFGIELDVGASRYGEAFVFHDEDLGRLTGETGPLCDREGDEVEKIRLAGSDETLPPLAEILDRIGGRAPLLIEVKARGPAYHQLCYSVSMALHEYPGPVGVMSFDPRVGHWFARHHPALLRGLVVTESGRRGLRGRVGRDLAYRWARPDFLAYDVRDLPSRFAAAARRRGLPVYTWTVRSEADRNAAAVHSDQIIFEAGPA